ncbi:MAG TPA: HAD-IIIC family phosphatase [Gemmatimonadales bacterium]|nr:HAD-IIIC family phosphatase [Gemmatimonadales bacterium]
MEPPLLKCVVWDLDDTVWHGTLLEGDRLVLRDGIAEVLAALDARGVLHSIASRNEPDDALAALERFGLRDYFLCPQIGWGPKPDSLRAIAAELGLGLNSLAFVDEQPAERAEVAFSLPEVRCLDPDNLAHFLALPELSPRFITDDSRARRRMYQETLTRNRQELAFAGPREDFLASLGMRLTIGPACESDLRRAEELTERTHQFNSTGHSYSHEELDRLRTSPSHTLLVAGLSDIYGSYGTVGLALVERDDALWTLKVLLVSCRVLSKGVASLLLREVQAEARRRGVALRAEIVPNERNVLMSVSYKFAGFRELERRDGLILYEDGIAELAPSPGHVSVITRDWNVEATVS